MNTAVTYWSDSRVICQQPLPLVKTLNVVLITDKGESASFSLNNPSFSDQDNDGIDASLDNCPNTANSEQTDSDRDGQGDTCDSCPYDELNDSDSDGLCSNVDNCPTVANPAQSDADNNGLGDACDTTEPDSDGDGILDLEDNCPNTANPSQVDSDDNGRGDACDTTSQNPDGEVDSSDKIDEGTDDENQDRYPTPGINEDPRAGLYDAKAMPWLKLLLRR